MQNDKSEEAAYDVAKSWMMENGRATLRRMGVLQDAQAQAGIRSMIQHYDDFERIKREALAAGGTNARDFATQMEQTAAKEKAAAIAAQKRENRCFSLKVSTFIALGNVSQ